MKDTTTILRTLIALLLWTATAASQASPGTAEMWLVTVPTEAGASDARRRLLEGEGFEALGGISLGVMSPEDVRPEFREAMAGLSPGEVSPVIPLDGRFAVFRWGEPALDERWREAHEAGVAAFQRGAYGEAAEGFAAAIAAAEDSGVADLRLARSLTGLAESHRLSGEADAAQPLYRRALTIRERIQGPDHTDLAPLLNNLAETYRLSGDPAAAGLYRRALGILEASDGAPLEAALILNNLAGIESASGDLEGAAASYGRSVALLEASVPASDPALLGSLAGLAEVSLEAGDALRAASLYRRILLARWGAGEADTVLEAFLENLADVLDLAFFQDADRDAALAEHAMRLPQLPPRADLYLAVRALLVEAERTEEAEQVMLHALQVLPDSRNLRYGLAELYLRVRKHAQAGAVLEGRLGEAADLDADDRRLVTLLGEVLTVQGRFDDAIAAYERARTLGGPDPAAEVALGNLYLSRDRLDEAEAAYQRAVESDPDLAEAHRGLAETRLRDGRFGEASEGARTAIGLDPNLARAHYVLAMALIRQGDRDAGQLGLDAYRRQEEATLSRETLERQASVLNRAAMVAFARGDARETVDLLGEAIELTRGATGIWTPGFSLGVVYRKLGEPGEAAAVFETMLEQGCCDSGGSFLAHRNLSEIYREMGDAEAGQRHYALYLKEYDAALAARAGPSAEEDTR